MSQCGGKDVGCLVAKEYVSTLCALRSASDPLVGYELSSSSCELTLLRCKSDLLRTILSL